MKTRRLVLVLLMAFGLSASAALVEAQRAVIAVRHAEKQSDSNDATVALSEAGRARARRLAAVLEASSVSAIYSTDTVRTLDTAAPLSRQLGIEIRKYSASDGDGKINLEPLARRIRNEHARETVLVVGHSNTIAPLLAALGCTETVDIPSSRYEDLFLVVPTGPGRPILLRLTY